MAWLIAAVVLFIAELFVSSFYLLIISISLVGAGFVSFFADHSAMPIITAAIMAALGLYWGQGYIKRHKIAQRHAEQDDDLDIGQTVHIIRHLYDNIYEVAYRGSYWQARVANGNSQIAKSSHTAVIVGKESNILLIHLHL